MTKRLIAIWAQDQAGLIGQNNSLPWHLPKELQHFKETTMGQAMLMGRVTFDGMNRRLLPGRETLILSRQADFEAEGIQAFTSPEAVLDWFQTQDKDLYIVGGAKVYEAMLPHCDQLVVTRVEGEFTGDTYFPEVDWSSFVPIAEQMIEADEANPHAFTITTYERKEEESRAT
ncbi:dihydrofolate reductase [Streptococcus cuniculipharyngis]|uniref:Dihydrofolate reductase n=1 Tax=Streptococcus cuniculipharyngis TaxID=1562651 RepID=A0A5C5SFJ2_9STRE|nr:dihydrofolate reductase [Streptococcus cuniculipharyngis]TWS98765.1 dihydrofolate reductase [Streptococcus cuniculipharyngis]